MPYKVEFKVKLPATVKKDSEIGMYVSCCPVLDVFSQGETIPKALENLQEAVSLFLLTCVEKGSLVKVLQDCGFSLVKHELKQKPAISPFKESIQVSIPFLAAKEVTRCHV